MIIYTEECPASLVGVRHLREGLTRRISDLNLPADLQNDIVLAIAELGNNIVFHGTPKATSIQLSVCLELAHIMVTVQDDGGPFSSWNEKFNQASREIIESEVAIGGRGLMLIGSAFDLVLYRSGPPNVFTGSRRIYAQRPRVLVLEDDHAQLAMYAAFLKEWDVVTAASLAEAITIHEEIGCDAVVSDFHVGDDDGAALAVKWNAAANSFGPTLITISADESIETRQRALRNGIEFFVPKPVSGSQLREVVSLALQRHAARNARLANTFTRHVNALWSDRPPLVSENVKVVTCGGTPSAGGGDFIVHDLHGERMRIVLVDVMGHGIGAKAWSIGFSAAVRMLLHRERELAPDGVLRALNGLVCSDSTFGLTIATIIVIQIERDGFVSWASAGHPGPVRLGHKTSEVGGASGPLLGVIADAEYSTHSMILERGERLMVYTDGVGDGEIATGGPPPHWLVSAAQHGELFVRNGETLATTCSAHLGAHPADDWTVVVLEPNFPQDS